MRGKLVKKLFDRSVPNAIDISFMGRPRQFEEHEVIARAMASFWARGYQATSVAHLTEATGLVKGSLYKAFGDKKNLFMRALESYLAMGAQGLAELEESSATGGEAIQRLLYGVAEAATQSGLRRGCFAVNSAVELGPHDAEVRARLYRYTQEKEDRIAGIVSRGMADGSLPSDSDPAGTARYLVIVTDGLQARGKLGMTTKEAFDAVGIALEGLGVSKQARRHS